MSATAVAALVERGDPERWRSAMTAPPRGAAGLMALYAFNLEIARAPWVASEPMLARDPAALVARTRSARSTTARRRGGTRWWRRWPAPIRDGGPAAAAASRR